MHSALFVAKVGLTFDHRRWLGFLGTVGSKVRNEDAKRLGENVWLVDFHKSPAILAWLVTSAESHAVPYGIIPFDAEPQWLPAGFDPTSIQVRSEGS